jgi:Uma2 family endonuclease
MRALQKRRWTRAEYEDLIERGVLTPDDKVELIEGEIVPVAPQNVPHTVAQRLVEDGLRLAFGPGYDVRPAMPLIAGDGSEPEPDVAVVRGGPRDPMRTGSHPSAAVLVVEISDTTLLTDRRRKARVYAQAGIPEYWIDNLKNRVLEVYRDPVVPAGNPSAARYASRLILREGDTVSPLGAPSAKIAVSDLLP